MIDVVLVVVLLAYAVSGFRQGLAVSALSLAGFLAGALVAILAVPTVADRMQPGLQRSLVVMVAVLVCAWLGQLLGALAGGKLRDQLPTRTVRGVDQAFGAVAGLVSVALVMWFIGGALRGSPSPVFARTVASSRVLATIDSLVPAQVGDLADQFRQAVAGSSFPRVFAGMGPETIVPVPSPNPKAMPSPVLAQAQRSIVKITGEAQACGRGQEGSGSVVGPERVLTNAHVVAGMRRPTVQVAGVGDQLPATVVLFDPRRDLAVLSVPGLAARPLALGHDLARGADAVIAGFPLNGGFTAGAARVRSVISASGEDIYGQPGAVRQVYALFGTVEPGNSGGPVLGTDGSLVGVVFAKSLDDPNTGYALTLGEVRGDLEQGLSATDRVSTDTCAKG